VLFSYAVIGPLTRLDTELWNTATSKYFVDLGGRGHPIVIPLSMQENMTQHRKHRLHPHNKLEPKPCLQSLRDKRPQASETGITKYCDVDGVSYAATSKVHVTSDVSVATQRLRIPKQPKCWNPQQR
jgi:hypothetical protein